MSTIEGGDFICGVHEFRTSSKDEFDNHCIETGHVIEGTAPCVFCTESTDFAGLPYTKIGRPVYVACDRCSKSSGQEFKRFRPYKLGDKTIVPRQLQQDQKLKEGEVGIKGSSQSTGEGK